MKSTNIAATTVTVDNRLVVSANMKVAAYTIANGGVAVWQGGFRVSATHTQVGGVSDTLGNLVVVGLDLFGNTQTETIVLVDGGVATGTAIFKSVTSCTTAGWVINTGNDTIKIGVQAGSYMGQGGGMLQSVTVNNVVAATVVISDASGTIATLPSSATVGQYLYMTPWAGYLKVATTSTNDVTVVHSVGVPATYALS